jgi:hypothetical protein
MRDMNYLLNNTALASCFFLSSYYLLNDGLLLGHGLNWDLLDIPSSALADIFLILQDTTAVYNYPKMTRGPSNQR